MPKLNTFQKLAALLAALVVAFINTVSYYKGDVAVRLAGNETATQIITPTVEWISEWAVVITLVAIIGLFVWAIFTYLRNRHAPKETDDSQYLKEISETLKRMEKRQNDDGTNLHP